MKGLSKIFTLLLLAGFLFSCGKEGPMGALGPQGDAGEVGPAGKDGSIIYGGQSAPDASLGNVGDYYVNTSTGDFYGPKQAAGWRNPFNLKGAKGDAGATGAKGDKGDKGDKGSQILSGNGTPATSLGAIGDFYLDKQNLLLYGPKLTATNWGAGLLLGGGGANPNVKSWVAKRVPIDNYFNVNIPALTNDIFNNGAVVVYGNGSDAPDSTVAWKFFPFLHSVTNPLGLTIRYEIRTLAFQNGFVRFMVDDGLNEVPGVFSGITVNIRIVLIQGTSGGILKAKPVGFDELQSIYNLRD